MKIRLLILALALALTVRFYSTSAQTPTGTLITVTYNNCTVVITNAVTTITCPNTLPPPPPLTCTVAPAPATLQVGVPIVLIDVSAQCTGGVKPYTFSALSFPLGIMISPTGVISGTPLTAGTFTLSWQATDSAGKTAQVLEQRIILDAKKHRHPSRSAGR